MIILSFLLLLAPDLSSASGLCMFSGPYKSSTAAFPWQQRGMQLWMEVEMFKASCCAALGAHANRLCWDSLDPSALLCKHFYTHLSVLFLVYISVKTSRFTVCV